MRAAARRDRSRAISVITERPVTSTTTATIQKAPIIQSWNAPVRLQNAKSGSVSTPTVHA